MIRSDIHNLRDTYEWIGQAYPRMPRYECLSRVLRLYVIHNRLSPGTRLPSLRRLAQCLGVSLVTGAAAYRQLEQQGLTVSVPGSGHRVAVDVNPRICAQRDCRRHARNDVPQPGLFDFASPGEPGLTRRVAGTR